MGCTYVLYTEHGATSAEAERALSTYWCKRRTQGLIYERHRHATIYRTPLHKNVYPYIAAALQVPQAPAGPQATGTTMRPSDR